MADSVGKRVLNGEMGHYCRATRFPTEVACGM